MHGREHSSSPLANDRMWIWMLQLNATLYIQFILKQKLVWVRPVKSPYNKSQESGGVPPNVRFSSKWVTWQLTEVFNKLRYAHCNPEEAYAGGGCCKWSFTAASCWKQTACPLQAAPYGCQGAARLWPKPKHRLAKYTKRLSPKAVGPLLSEAECFSLDFKPSGEWLRSAI